MSKLATRVAVLAFPGISPFHLSIPCVVFGDMGNELTSYTLSVCACEPGRIDTSAGFAIEVSHGLAALQTADILIIPSWDIRQTPSPALIATLQSAHTQGKYLIGLCLGAFVLAEAGLLAGNAATTHWAYAEEFARRYPDVLLDASVLYVEGNGVMTSAGTAAALDCCLAFVRRQHGSNKANRLARRLVIAPHREGGQAQFIEQPLPSAPADKRLAALIDWVRKHLHEVHSIDSLAQRVHMSRRSFTRHFRQVCGSSITQWLINERLAMVQHLLEGGDLDMESIAAQCGFGSSITMRQHFQQAFGMPPQQWRRLFRA